MSMKSNTSAAEESALSGALAEGSEDLERRKTGRMARLWGRLLTSESAFDPALMQSLNVLRAQTTATFDDAIALRKIKYREQSSAQIEPEDTASSSDIYVCYGTDNRALGSIRASFDLAAQGTLKLHSVTTVPERWSFRADGSPTRLAEGMRLCVLGRTRQEQLCVKLALWRAVYLRCVELEVDWLLSVARPPLNNDYLLISYERHAPEPHWIYPPDNPVAHELLALNIRSEQVSCRQPGHWINRAFFGTSLETEKS
jgi:hypothetical protein